MKYIEAKITINADNPGIAEELIVSIFDDLKLKGVVIEDPNDGLRTATDNTGNQPIDHTVTGYFPADSPADSLGEKLRIALESSLDDLKICQGIATSVIYRKIDEEDWAESWKAFFWPEKISDHIVVKPTWREYEPSPDELIVEIDPGMAFGTGTHPTTALCIQILEKRILPGQSLLDVGTGSGILLIAAAKLGAGNGIGMDNDHVATGVARSNLKINNLDPARFSVAAGNLIDPIASQFDLITANILTDVILELIGPLHRVLKPGGLFICSGIIEAYADKVVKHLKANNFQQIEKRFQGDWAGIVARRGDNKNDSAGAR